MSIPRLVIAAPSSGAGKTTVATGLMAALRDRGLRVSGHKVGPDYIDPGYHAMATGRPGRNLDPVMVGESLIPGLFLHGAAGADIAVVEGVMGLYDGRSATAEGSTAHVAALLGAPVVLVVDASSQSRSVAALVHGFSTYDPAVRVAGVVLNRVASDRHEQVLREALDGTPVLGVVRRDAGLVVPSRHLGLVPPAERRAEATEAVERMSAVVRRSLDLDAVLQIARSAPDLAASPWSPPARTPGSRPVVAVAGGPAFTFAYAETAECLTAAGADVVDVDPLVDQELPAGTAALVLPGGFPEVYAEQLAGNSRFLAAVRAHLARPGSTTYAECAGLLLLCTALDGRPMVGHLPAAARMTDRLTLGYRTAATAGPTLLGPAGSTVTGHEFHRTVVEPGHGPSPAWRMQDGTVEGFAEGTALLASYLHLHPAGVPALATGIVDAAVRSPVVA